MIDNTDQSGSIDTSYFQSILYYCAWWRYYGITKKLPTDIYVCTDFGDSCYHTKINKKYKYRRKIGVTLLPEFHEILTEIKSKNTQLAENILNKIPHVNFMYLKYLESDFLPYYLITRKFSEEENTLHIICSSDKDMYQSLLNENIVQVFKIRENKTLLTGESCLLTYVKSNKTENVNKKIKDVEMVNNVEVPLIPLLMSFVGDNSDDVPGVKLIGPKKALSLVSEKEDVKKLFGSIEELMDRLMNDENIFKSEVNDLVLSDLHKDWKKIFLEEKENNIVSDAFKQISFEMLCRWLERKNSTEKIKYLKYIDEVLEKKEVIEDRDILYNGLVETLPEFVIKDKQLGVFYYEDFK